MDGCGVAFNGKFLNAPARGLSRVASELIRATDEMLAEQPDRAAARSWELVCRRDASPGPPLGRIARHGQGRLNWPLWEQAELPGFATGRLLVNLCNMSPLAVTGAITFIHDAHVFMMPESHSLSYAAWYRFALPRVARASSRVVTVSEFSRDRLVEYGVAPADKIVVIRNGAEHLLRHAPDASVLGRLGLAPEGYVLALANRQPHKNIRRLFEAFRHPALAGLELVLVGPHDAHAFAAAGHDAPPQAVFAGHVSDEALRALYEHALCFASPSLMEGFGLPVLEALSLSCPVVAAPCAALPEVCGEAAIYADARDPMAWVEAISALRTDGDARRSLQARGRTRALGFSWRAGAARLLDLIDEVSPPRGREGVGLERLGRDLAAGMGDGDRTVRVRGVADLDGVAVTEVLEHE